MNSIPLAALDRLNGHARANGFGKKAIYAYKTLAALDGVRGRPEAIRFIALQSKCHGCNGTGTFVYWDGEKGGPCRQCSRQGYVWLRFVESEIDGVRWHHPLYSGGIEIAEAAKGMPLGNSGQGAPHHYYNAWKAESGEAELVDWQSPGEWKPNQPGRRLASEEALTLLNEVEDWLERRKEDLILRQDWPRLRAVGEMMDYTVDLDRSAEPEQACCICRKVRPVYVRFGHIGHHLSWALPCCKECSATPWEQRPKDIPAELLTPAVRRWLARHEPRWTPPAADQ